MIQIEIDTPFGKEAVAIIKESGSRCECCNKDYIDDVFSSIGKVTFWLIIILTPISILAFIAKFIASKI